MEVKVRVILNGNEINQANATNAANAQKRAAEPKKATEYVDVEVPAQKVEYYPMLIHPSKELVKLAYVDVDGDIRVLYDGQTYSVKNEAEVWNQLVSICQ